MDATDQNEQGQKTKISGRVNVQKFRPKKRSLFSYLLPILLIAAVLGSSFFRFFSSEESESVGISELYADAEAGRVEEFTICEGKVEAKLKDSDTIKVANYRGTNFEDVLIDKGKLGLSLSDIRFNYCDEPVDWAMVINGIFNILMFVGIIGLGLFLIRGIQSSGNKLFTFGKSKAKLVFGRKPDLTFDDVANYEEAKEELREIVLFLKDPKRFLKLGARIPKGLLLVGPPGTGKTYFARAVAGEAGVPFFHTSGAEFEEMLVGAGASRVRDLFAKAKRAAPALIFVDEIDAVARKRGTTIQSSSTEQTLNQILVEMDGFEQHVNVIVIAATNRPDVLDPAILRPGRFDRRIVLDLPDIDGRKKILQVHAKNKPMAKDVNLERVAKRTVGFSGADLENMLNEAAIIAAKDGRKEVEAGDIEEAATKVVIGPERKRKRTEKDIELIAYHEAGHALVSKFVPQSDPVHRITIISRGMSLGSTMYLPEDDELLISKTKIVSKVKTLLAGRAAEELRFNDISTGASDDIEKASDLARRMVMKYGMSKKLGLVEYGKSDKLKYLGYAYQDQRDYSEETAREIDNEVRQVINDAYSEVLSILKKNENKLNKLANLLIEKEVVEAVEFEKMMGDGNAK
ncbi:MAG: ATP-dependent zinc metalloprotease FtsH [Patescibacteria group bacterium]|nr:ATP-dependent zinc metalloprotease FtsH [Patescibacteria group bacterium]